MEDGRGETGGWRGGGGREGRQDGGVKGESERERRGERERRVGVAASPLDCY